MSSFSSILIGNESLTVECGKQILSRGHVVSAVVTTNPDVRSWAAGLGLDVLTFGPNLAARIGAPVDWIFSVANLRIIPDDVLALGQKGAVNFHDGPLPRYAGLNAPVWALLNGETAHGITWHLIEGGVDEGRILAQQDVSIYDEDTALSLNTKCYAAAIDSFGQALDSVEGGAAAATVQDLSQRSYFAKDARPAQGGIIDLAKPYVQVLRHVRGLDHGPYWNPLCTAKLRFASDVVSVGSARHVTRDAGFAAGTVLDITAGSIVITCADGAVEFDGLHHVDGTDCDLYKLAATGDVLPSFEIVQSDQEALSRAAKHDGYYRRILADMTPSSVPLAASERGIETADIPLKTAEGTDLIAAFDVFARRLTGKTCTVALGISQQDNKQLSRWVPLTCDGTASASYEALISKGGFALDLALRAPEIQEIIQPALGLGFGGMLEGCVLTLDLEQRCLHYDTAALDVDAAALLAARLDDIADHLFQGTVESDIPVIPIAERTMLLETWNATEADYDQTATVHGLFEDQVRSTPDAIALVVEDSALTYAQLNALANRAAHGLRALGVTPGDLVGLYTERNVHMMVGALAILKAGGAYVPLDPAYPADRIALYLEDSGASVIATTAALGEMLETEASLLALDSEALSNFPDDDPKDGAGPDDLAYLIFTSGSTGRPKGVMVEHRNVVNFFAGMDSRVPQCAGATWLAVTSLNFDISVLELFYTLARGFKIVLGGQDNRAALSGSTRVSSGASMDFSLYYWGNDDGAGEKKYELLLEGAKFADQNGFCAVWTPERHFHAFGGPYPNPSVTGAAVAAVTKNIGVRSGSCVAPLHHPARIAEEWSVIDNLTNGRAGLAMASGWQPDDFVLRPENTPPQNKAALMDSIDTVRKLWRGEEVAFPTANGGTHGVITQPRPVSKDVPIWVTTAGNPETWKDAGRIGAHVLTHLLGQSVDEVAEKIEIYHAALREAGHNPTDFKVTLMLHTFIAEDRETARDIAREPMKDYLRSAAGLIKQYAWAFPAFKKPKGANNAFDLDLGSLEPEELEGILDFAFLRYFEDSGLFGTVDDCLKRVEGLKKIGVNEVACLIDYGIDTATVLEGLRPLADVVQLSNQETELAEDDFSLAAQILRHDVTHLQCTPSMARMLLIDDGARAALGHIKHMMVGGEPLPGALVADLQQASTATLENMYGPTETTIWSTTRHAEQRDGTAPLGTPIANTQLYILDEDQNLLPVGQEGELFIAGDGVTRGYWQREDLTADRFLPDPFRKSGRMYRTGDLVRRLADGDIEFLGRVDHQVKIRGHRIELGEIESILEAETNVRQAVVAAREDTPGDVRLVAYVTAESRISETDMRTSLSAVLPAHMVPAHIMQIDAFPLTPNKKVDRGALPAPQIRREVAKVDAPVVPSVSEAAQGQTVTAVGAIWAKTLGLDAVSANDNFFDLGGHSLLAVQAHREIKEALSVPKLSITDVFRFPVLSALCARIDELRPANEKGENTKPVMPAPVQNDARAAAMSKRRAMRASRMRG